MILRLTSKGRAGLSAPMLREIEAAEPRSARFGMFYHYATHGRPAFYSAQVLLGDEPLSQRHGFEKADTAARTVLMEASARLAGRS